MTRRLEMSDQPRTSRHENATPAVAIAPQSGLFEDLRLFGLTFVGGLLFMTIYLA